jgi:hypothetical protein
MEQTEHKARLIDSAGITGLAGDKQNIFSIKRSAAIVHDLHYDCFVEEAVVCSSEE